MTKMKNPTRRALMLFVMALVLCFTMLVGTTYAWFTDSVTSGKNKIVAGNLDIELYHTSGAKTVTETDDNKVEGATTLFQPESGLWEPGVVVVENFLVKNVGTLALKYQFALNALVKGDYNTVTWGDDKTTYDLTDVIKVAIVDGAYLNKKNTLRKFECLNSRISL